MEPTTLRLPEDLANQLADEADEIGYSSRSEYIRHILRNRSGGDPNTQRIRSGGDQATSGHADADLVELVERLDDRLGDLESRVVTDAPERRETPVESDMGQASEPDERAHDATEPDLPPPPGVETDTDVDDGDDLDEALREWIEDRAPKKRHAKDLVVDVFRELRSEGTLATGDLQDRLFPDYDEYYSSDRTMWNAISRYLEDVPGIQKGDYGEWDYAGDDVARLELDLDETDPTASEGPYDPTEEF